MFRRLFENIGMMVYLILLLLIMLAAILLFESGHKDTAWAVAYLGTPLVILGCIVYIVFFDSKKRWPDLTSSQRLTRLMTLQR